MPLSIRNHVPGLNTVARNSSLLCIDVGMILARMLDVFTRYGFVKGQTRLVGIVNRAAHWAQVRDDLPDFDWLNSPVFRLDSSYFVFALHRLDTTPTDWEYKRFDPQATVWTGTSSDGDIVQYLVVGVRQMALQICTTASAGAVFALVEAFTENWRKKRLLYPRSRRYADAYRNLRIGATYTRYAKLPYLTALATVPYPMWWFVQSIWENVPSVLTNRMLNEYTATYYSNYLTDSASEALAFGALNAMVRDTLDQAPSGSIESVGDYLTESARLATFDAVEDVESFSFADCLRLSSSSWPLLVESETEEQFEITRQQIVEHTVDL